MGSTRPTSKQWEIILDYLESNPEMVSGRGTGSNGKQSLKEKWETLVTMLNSLGYTNKPTEKWIKTWTDFKSTLKKKAAVIKKDQIKTGGGPSSCKALNEYEERALQLLGPSFIGLSMAEAGLPSAVPLYSKEEIKASTQACTITTATLISAMPQPHCSRDNFSIMAAPTETPPQIITSKTVKRNFLSPSDEHNYTTTPKKRKSEGLMEQTYEETILVLKNIDAKLDSIEKHMASMAGSQNIMAEYFRDEHLNSKM